MSHSKPTNTTNANTTHTHKPRPHEFMQIMQRLELIEEEMKKEQELYDIKLKSLQLEKEYLQSKLGGI